MTHIRRRMLGHLQNVSEALFGKVSEGLGMQGEADMIKPAVPAKASKPSPALSEIKKSSEDNKR